MKIDLSLSNKQTNKQPEKGQIKHPNTKITIKPSWTKATWTQNYHSHQINMKHNPPDCVSGQVEWTETKPSALPALIGYYMATIKQ